MSGKSVEEVEPAVQEMIFATTTGWTLDYIRSLEYKDYITLWPMVLRKFALDCYKPVLG